MSRVITELQKYVRENLHGTTAHHHDKTQDQVLYCNEGLSINLICREGAGITCIHMCDRTWENPPYGTTYAIVLQAYLLARIIII